MSTTHNPSTPGTNTPTSPVANELSSGHARTTPTSPTKTQPRTSRHPKATPSSPTKTQPRTSHRPGVTPEPSRAWVPQWRADILGQDYQAATIPLGPDPDHEDPIEATLVRFTGAITPRPGADTASPTPALIYVHGMSDYFFHDHLAREAAAHGFRTYAVDLRKCGRSHHQGNTWHHVTDLTFYDEELTLALEAVIRDDPAGTSASPSRPVVIIAHSTGGLVVAGWLNRMFARGGAQARLASHVRGVVLNSPWLDLHVPNSKQRFVETAVGVLSRVPSRWRIGLPGKPNDTYGRTLHQEFGGEWDYRLQFKPPAGFPKLVVWLRAIIQAQRDIRQERVHLPIPVLMLSSDQSTHTPTGSNPELLDPARVDVVLDVSSMARRARQLGPDVRIHPIAGAMHDVYLSHRPARQEALDATLEFAAQCCSDN